MTNKKYFIFFAVILVVAAAAFVGGRMLNGQIGASLGFLPFLGGQDGMMASSIELLPAAELPTARPDITGSFAERKDNSIFVQAFSMDGTTSSMSGGSTGAVVAVGSAPTNDGPKVEVVVTNETKIYRDSTDFGKPQPGKNTTIQQTVEPGSLDDLHAQTMVTVWGRKNGDRIIADVLSYSVPVMIQK
jgi:hypothetical protein